MLGLFMCIFEVKKELLVGLSITVLYITYYLVDAVKKPMIVCSKGEFREMLENDVPVLQEHYWPTPWCVESRLQTVVGSILRTLFMKPLQYDRQVLRLSDGGQVALDWAETEEERGAPRPVLLVLPGLTGGSHADYVRCLAGAARELRAHLVVFNNRGLGGMPLTSPRLYCAVSHEDLAEVARAVRERRSGPLLAVGVSLGGLILGQHLARAGGGTLVAAALAVSPPLDVERGSRCVERPPLNALLSYHCARQLRRTVDAHEARLRLRPAAGGECDWREVRRSRTVRQFDAAFTAAHFGFRSVEEYYRAATLADKLGAVVAPLLCLCAADDPFQPLEAMPLAAAADSARVALAVTARGGHIGWLEGWRPAARDPAAHYIARLATQYFAALLARPHLLHRPPAD